MFCIIRFHCAGACWSWGDSAEPNQTSTDCGCGDVQWGSFILWGGCASGQHTVAGAANPQKERRRLHVSSLNTQLIMFHSERCCSVSFLLPVQVWDGIKPVGSVSECSEWGAGQTEWPQILAPLVWWRRTHWGCGHTLFFFDSVFFCEK